ncbi:MAG: PD40 domain-containing protein [Myxococcales bacterium]|nr:PD40 domain-containing protein [Myxococcales bacterium]
MRLTKRPRASQRAPLSPRVSWRARACALLLALAAASPAGAAPAEERDPEDILGELVVAATRGHTAVLRLPKIAVLAGAAEASSDRLRDIIARDLELSGEFDVLPEAPAPSDLAGWRAAGAEYLLTVDARAGAGEVLELAAALHATDDASAPLFEAARPAQPGEFRLAAHRVADAVIGAVTGYSGPFASQLTYVVTRDGARRVYTIDPDGYRPRARSPEGQLALSPAYGPDGALYYAASVNHGAYRVYTAGADAPIQLEPRGSVYGLTFTEDRRRVAVSIATGGGVTVFVGPSDFSELAPVSRAPLAMHPAFSPKGGLAYAGSGRGRQRVYVDGKPVSPAGLTASAPVFCRHPDGARLVYGVELGAREDLLVADDRGREPVRLTREQGRNRYPACSPDGRLIAFFSTRTTGEGPGLYVMRVDGRRPRKISSALGDTLRWSRLP